MLSGGAKVLGFDTETKPSWTAGTPNSPTGLIQLATADKAVLIRVRTAGRWLFRDDRLSRHRPGPPGGG
jgi:hypothetical protein